jgi:acyltransferase-like protein
MYRAVLGIFFRSDQANSEILRKMTRPFLWASHRGQKWALLETKWAATSKPKTDDNEPHWPIILDSASFDHPKLDHCRRVGALDEMQMRSYYFAHTDFLILSAALSERKRLDALTGLRFFAAIEVVVFHERALFAHFPAFLRNAISNGDVAVSLFFILSGFVLAYNYIRPQEKSLRVENREFWLARFARIYPGYFLAALMFSPAVILGRSVIAHGEVLATFLSTLSRLRHGII